VDANISASPMIVAFSARGSWTVQPRTLMRMALDSFMRLSTIWRSGNWLGPWWVEGMGGKLVGLFIFIFISFRLPPARGVAAQ
jgi:hypothetical protein